jgi:hypothetical protein
MKTPAFHRAIALLLAGAACAGGALAQTGKTMKDVEPLPPEDRASIGAVVLTNEPVLAQKEQLPDTAQSRNPTSMMGAGPAVQPRKRSKAQLDADRLREAEEIMRGGAGALQEK